MPSNHALVKKAKQVAARRKRACDDLFYLLTEILHSPENGVHYNLFSEEWHKPICAWIDENQDHEEVALFAPRYSYKTWMQHGEIIRDILKNPLITIFLIHHNLEEANKVVSRVAWHFQHNEKLRELFPKQHRPPKLNEHGGKNWFNKGDGGKFRMPGLAQGESTIIGQSCGKDITGTHPKIVYADDIISEKSVLETGGVKAITNWVARTLTPVLGTTGKLRVRGTFWSTNDWYHDIIKDKGFKCHKRAILETDGKPDWDGKPIKIYVPTQESGGRRWLNQDDIDRYKRKMPGDFGGQMMNDPTPEGSKPWSSEKCENFVGFPSIRKVISEYVLLIDPAPLGTDVNQSSLKVAFDKSYWAMSVVSYAWNQKRMLRFLMDGAASKEWTWEQGIDVACDLAERWKVRLIGVEEPRAHGQNLGLMGSRIIQNYESRSAFYRGRTEVVSFRSVQRGKKPRIHDLAALAALQDFTMLNDPGLIDSIHGALPLEEDRWQKGDLLTGSRYIAAFIDGMRAYAGEKQSLFLDIIDATAYCDDTSIIENLILRPASELRNDPLENAWWGNNEAEQENMNVFPMMGY